MLIGGIKTIPKWVVYGIVLLALLIHRRTTWSPSSSATKPWSGSLARVFQEKNQGEAGEALEN
jgi:hypothetical protein